MYTLEETNGSNQINVNSLVPWGSLSEAEDREHTAVLKYCMKRNTSRT